MTNKEAHEYMENEIMCIQKSKYCDRNCVKCELVKEDKTLIEAYRVALSAIEKQIPKKPTRTNWIYCPSCNWGITLMKGTHHCPKCGQALDWSERNGG